MSQHILTLDVREDFRLGQHPREKIMEALDQIGADAILRLLVPFEPVPLYEIAGGKGFDHLARKISEGDWEVLFTRNITRDVQSRGCDAKVAHSCDGGAAPAKVVEVDARGLEPPQPMVNILEALAGLSDGAMLRARTDRRPLHLYPMLEARGFIGESTEESDGSYITLICRRQT